MKEQATRFLVRTQNPDGGWGSQPGKQSNTESTAFALLALSALGEKTLNKSVGQGLSWLANNQNKNGSFPFTAGLKQGSWASAVAILALHSFETHRPLAQRCAEWLLRQKGRSLGLLASLQYWLVPEENLVKLDPFLKGWPWTSGSFSWVEPTAYSLIALKKIKRHLNQEQLTRRIREGELMIYDRMCVGGGWNYGNSNILGENLWPYPDITALALIALQDHPANPANQLSVKVLQRMLGENHSGLALGWSCICFALYGQEVSPWISRLEKSYSQTEFLGETKSIALGLLALVHRPEAFRI